MDIQYLHDENGKTTAVLVPIEEWKVLTELPSQTGELPQWQKNMLDERLVAFRKNPNDTVSMEEIEKILEEEDEEV